MPELPEVEVSARIVRSTLKSGRIEHIYIKDSKLFRPPKSTHLQYQVDTGLNQFEQSFIWETKDLLALLNGAQPIAPYTLRLGKLMACLFQTKDQRVLCLFARLGMTGKFVKRSANTEPHKSTKLSFTVVKNSRRGKEKLRLDFLNTRMFGHIWAQCSSQQVHSDQKSVILKAIFDTEVKRSAMGLDAYKLSSQPEAWINHIRAYANHRKVKTALLDQSLFAGIGNIYAAECLFKAHAHPQAKFSQLSDEQLALMAQGLYDAMTATLERSKGKGEVIYGSGVGPQSPFAVYGREGEPCYLCQRPLAFLRIAGRATVFCEHCQEAKT